MKVTKRSQKVLAIIMLSLMMLGSFMYLKPKADGADTSAAEAEAALKTAVYQGSITTSYDMLDFATDEFKTEGGGFKLYTSISNYDNYINADVFSTLKAGEKQKFLKDELQIGNAMVYATENDDPLGGGVTSDTLNGMLQTLQDKSGMGSQLLATLLSETKPDYATANRLYKPFSGVVGTILGVISILIMALLGITMALDIAFIVIPAFQLIMGGDDGGNGKEGSKFSKLISVEARNAVNAAEGGGGAGGQDGSGHKMALGIYFKARWKGLVILGICLLYLVQGQIYSFVAWVIDLLSGFLGF